MDEKLYKLWKLLDDIDTAGDIAKDNDKAYREMVEKLHKQRFTLLTSSEIDTLYNKFYNKDK